MADKILTQLYHTGPLSAMRMIPSHNEKESEIYRHLIPFMRQKRIDEYDCLCTKMLQHMLEGTYNCGDFDVEISNVYVKFPKHSEKINDVTKRLLLTPYLAGLIKLDYVCEVYCTMKTITRGNNPESSKSLLLGYIPCMVGSSRCISSVKPDEFDTIDEWKSAICEPLPPGYYIRKGVKVALLTIIKKASHIIFTTNPKGAGVFTSIKNLKAGKTTIIEITEGKPIPTVQIVCPHILDKGHYTVFFVFYMLYFNKEKKFKLKAIIDLICSFAKSNEVAYIRSYLHPSIKVFIDKGCETSSSGSKKPSLQKIHAYAIGKIKKSSEKKKNSQRQYSQRNIHNFLLNEIFPIETNIGNKIVNLAYAVYRHIRCCVGFKNYENEDHGHNKRLDNGIYSIVQSVNNHFKNVILSNATITNKWLIGLKDKEEKSLEYIKPDSYSLIMGTIDTVKVNVDINNKSFELRRAQPTGFGGVCPVTTSDGKTCGMTGTTCIATHISWDREYDKTIIPTIRSILKLDCYFSIKKQKGYKPIMLNDDENLLLSNSENSRVKLYCNKEFIDKFLDIKKNKQIKDEEFSIVEDTDVYIFNFKPNSKNELESIELYNGFFMNINCTKNIQNILRYFSKTISKYCSTVRTKDHTCTFSYNSTVFVYEDEEISSYIPTVLWFNPKLIVDKIKYFIRQQILPMDTCVIFNEEDSEIKFLYDSGRMMYPALICDENGDLVIDKIDDGNYINNVWSSTEDVRYVERDPRIQDMFNRGIMELVDLKVKNQFIAETIDECRRFSNLRFILNKLDLRDCDPYFYNIDDLFVTEDTSYVKINDKLKDIKFKLEKSDDIDNQLKFNVKVKIDGVLRTIQLYGYYSITIKNYTIQPNVFIVNKPSDCTIRDLQHLCYVKNNQIRWITSPVKNDQIEYKGYNIVELNFSTSDTKQVIIKTIGSKSFLVEVKYRYFKNEGKSFFYEQDGKIKWSSKMKYSDDGEPYSYVNFDDKNEGFFDCKDVESLLPVTEDMNYETFDYYKEYDMFHNNMDKQRLNRECDYLMTFRRNQTHLDIINPSKFEDPNHLEEVFEFLREKYPQFRKRSNIFKISNYLNTRFKFTHCPIDPGIMFSAIANMAIKANHNQGPRWTYQGQMSKQAETYVNQLYFTFFDASAKQCKEMEPNIVEPVAAEALYGNMLSTKNYIVATSTNMDGFEDAIVGGESLLLKYCYLFTLEHSLNDTKSVAYPTNEYGNSKVSHKFRNLDSNGYPKIGSIMEYNDRVLGIMKTKTTGENVDASAKLEFGDQGKVTQLRTFCNNTGTSARKTIEIRMTSHRLSEPGSKFAAAHSQKGTVSQIYRDLNTKGENLKIPGFYVNGEFEFLDWLGEEGLLEDEVVDAVKEGKLKFKIVDDGYMPRVFGGKNHGMVVELIFNSFGAPTRMTNGMIIEQMAGKAGLIKQKKMDGSIFHKNEIDDFERILQEDGRDKHGCEFMVHRSGEVVRNITTGKPARISVMPCGYKKLKHDPYEKIAICFVGKKDPLTGQTTHGRKKKGGQRFGDMEKTVVLSHGAAKVILDIMVFSSDLHSAIFCKYCGKASSNSNVVKGSCKICGSINALCVMTQTRVFNVILKYLQVAGIDIKFSDAKLVKNTIATDV